MKISISITEEPFHEEYRIERLIDDRSLRLSWNHPHSSLLIIRDIMGRSSEELLRYFSKIYIDLETEPKGSRAVIPRPGVIVVPHSESPLNDLYNRIKIRHQKTMFENPLYRHIRKSLKRKNLTPAQRATRRRFTKLKSQTTSPEKNVWWFILNNQEK